MESSSRVTVTYWDASSVFPLIESDVRAHLPLRNLHWKAPSRPLRSISTLHVELVPYTGQNNLPPLQNVDDSNDRRPSLTPSLNSFMSPQVIGTSGKRRRHQIPGLRNTPYLKVYILRCDDNETYKTTSRKLLREWITTHALSAGSSSPGPHGAGGSTSSASLVATGGKDGSGSGSGAGSGGKQKLSSQHDACEWLIIHVVLPGTQAYSQPRAYAPSTIGGGPMANRGWPGMKGTTSLLEKIRADFNTSGKSGIKDRVVQLRVHPNRPDLQTISPTVPVSPYTLFSSLPEPKEETDAAYQELATKVKEQILRSFDARVAQYEDDIKEKDAQRRLPGWNFCTFFVLKEGLARAFESVGLIEDALVLYDELAIGLETFLREDSQDGKGALSIGEWTLEARGWLVRALERWKRKKKGLDGEKDYGNETDPEIEGAEGENGEKPRDAGKHEERKVGDETSSSESDEARLTDFDQPLSPYKKPYRDLILSNQISVFDFKCYLFSRQLNLLLRLGGSHNAIPTPTMPFHPSTAGSSWSFHDPRESAAQSGDEDLRCLAEICRRGVEFVTPVGGVLRKDLYKAWKSLEPGSKLQSAEGEEESMIMKLIDDIVKNWMFSVCNQLLVKTGTGAIPAQVLYGVPNATNIPLGGSGSFPKRTSSLPSTPSADITTFMLRERQREEQAAATHSLASTPTAPSPAVANPGLEELAAARGDVLILARSLVGGLAKRKGWMGNWEFGELEKPRRVVSEVDLRDTEEQQIVAGVTAELQDMVEGTEVGCGITNKALRKAIHSETGFYELFEELSEKARRHFVLGKKSRSVERVVADIATMKFSAGDYRTAAYSLEQLTKFYSTNGWSMIETDLLTMYSACLKKMDRLEEYVKMLLKLLAKSVLWKKRWEWKRADRSGAEYYDNIRHHDTDFCESIDYHGDDGLNTQGYVPEVIALSSKISQNIQNPMTDFWSDIAVEPYPRHLNNRDGYEVMVKMKYLLDEEMDVQSMKVRLISMVGGPSAREIWMTCGPKTFRTGMERVWLQTNINIPGSYIVDQIVISSHNLSFVHEVLEKTTPSTPIALTASNAAAAISAAKRSKLYFWPNTRSLSVRLSLPKKVVLEETRAVEIELCTGWNELQRAELVIRSATGGLRLLIGNLDIVAGRKEILSGNIGKRAKAGTIMIGEMAKEEKLVIRIPYTSEGELMDLAVKAEITYHTSEGGEFFFSSNPRISVALPLAVNVQDVFKRDCLFSKFLVSTALDVPLRIFAAKLNDSDVYRAVTGVGAKGNMLVIPKQPAAFVYKITRKDESYSNNNGRRPLALEIDYRSLDDEINLSVSFLLMRWLTNNNLERYTHLLLPVLKSKLDTIALHKLQTAGLTNEIQLGTYEDLGWDGILEGVSPRPQVSVNGESLQSPREQLANCLRKFHELHADIEIPGSPSEDMSFEVEMQKITRQIVIPVEVPQLDVIHTVEMKLIDRDDFHEKKDNFAYSSAFSSSSLFILGSAIPATLIINHSRAWSGLESSESPLERLEFYYDVHAPVDTWLIGGRKRGHFTTSHEGETFKFPLLLMPMRSGHLLMPGVEVKPAGKGTPAMSSETNYGNGAESVVVVGDARSCTVKIGGGEERERESQKVGGRERETGSVSRSGSVSAGSGRESGIIAGSVSGWK